MHTERRKLHSTILHNLWTMGFDKRRRSRRLQRQFGIIEEEDVVHDDGTDAVQLSETYVQTGNQSLVDYSSSDDDVTSDTTTMTMGIVDPVQELESMQVSDIYSDISEVDIEESASPVMTSDLFDDFEPSKVVGRNSKNQSSIKGENQDCTFNENTCYHVDAKHGFYEHPRTEPCPETPERKKCFDLDPAVQAALESTFLPDHISSSELTPATDCNHGASSAETTTMESGVLQDLQMGKPQPPPPHAPAFTETDPSATRPGELDITTTATSTMTTTTTTHPACTQTTTTGVSDNDTVQVPQSRPSSPSLINLGDGSPKLSQKLRRCYDWLNLNCDVEATQLSSGITDSGEKQISTSNLSEDGDNEKSNRSSALISSVPSVLPDSSSVPTLDSSSLCQLVENGSSNRNGEVERCRTLPRDDSRTGRNSTDGSSSSDPSTTPGLRRGSDPGSSPGLRGVATDSTGPDGSGGCEETSDRSGRCPQGTQSRDQRTTVGGHQRCDTDGIPPCHTSNRRARTIPQVDGSGDPHSDDSDSDGSDTGVGVLPGTQRGGEDITSSEQVTGVPDTPTSYVTTDVTSDVPSTPVEPTSASESESTPIAAPKKRRGRPPANGIAPKRPRKTPAAKKTSSTSKSSNKEEKPSEEEPQLDTTTELNLTSTTWPSTLDNHQYGYKTAEICSNVFYLNSFSHRVGATPKNQNPPNAEVFVMQHPAVRGVS